MSYPVSQGQYNFYFKYLWSPADFLQLQTWLQNYIVAIGQGGYGAACLQGLQVSPGGGLSVNIAPGIGLGDEAEPVVNATVLNETFSAPVAQPRWDLLVLRPTVTQTDFIPNPANPAMNVPLQATFGFDVIDITGTESVTPSYPAKQDGDVILCGVQLIPGQSTIGQSNIDNSVRSLPPKATHRVSTISAAYNVQSSDDTLDANATAGAFVAMLPPALSCLGQDFVITKIDSSANAVTVSGSDPIAGQGSVVLDAQWMDVHLRSVGNGWRVL